MRGVPTFLIVMYSETGESMPKRIGMVAGSFDPITKGHLWLIESGAKLFDVLYVVVGVNPSKKYTFTPDERLTMVKDALQHIDPEQAKKVVLMYSQNNLLIRLAQQVGATTLVRGVRNSADYMAEAEISRINKRLDPEIETVLLLTPADMSEVSSSTVKGFVGFEGWESALDPYVTPEVKTALITKFSEQH